VSEGEVRGSSASFSLMWMTRSTRGIHLLPLPWPVSATHMGPEATLSVLLRSWWWHLWHGRSFIPRQGYEFCQPLHHLETLAITFAGPQMLWDCSMAWKTNLRLNWREQTKDCGNTAYKGEICWVWAKIHFLHVASTLRIQKRVGSWSQCSQIIFQLCFSFFFYPPAGQCLMQLPWLYSPCLYLQEGESRDRWQVWKESQEGNLKYSITLQLQSLFCHRLPVRLLQPLCLLSAKWKILSILTVVNMLNIKKLTHLGN
jgi:hypothetical protein